VLRIFSPEKSDGFGRVLNPPTWVPKASTLPLDHRSRYIPSIAFFVVNILNVFLVWLPDFSSNLCYYSGTSCYNFFFPVAL
jgi:hypothetical protein